MQVIDSKGAMVGNVKDVSVDFRKKSLAFRIATKTHSEMDVGWEDVLSVEDVVLLRKEIDLEPVSPAPPEVIPPPTPIVQTALICPNCGSTAPGHAKFCPKCGTALK
jgi:sporulation protein YlmC with PRC-barrel domain